MLNEKANPKVANYMISLTYHFFKDKIIERQNIPDCQELRKGRRSREVVCVSQGNMRDP